MPIEKDEFESGRILSDIEKAVIAFLKKNPNKAFTISEIIDGINLKADFHDFWNAVFSVIGIWAFQSILNNLVTSRKIRVNIINGIYYYMAR